MPHLQEIMDVLGSEHPSQTVVAMMASQTGKSSVLLNWLLYTIIYDPCPFLLVQPDVERSEDFSKGRIAPMISACSEARALVADPKSRDSGNTVRSKLFPGGKLISVGMNSPAGLASNPIRRAAIDEVDRAKSSAGNEGSQIALVRKRQASYANRKLFVCSSPTIDGEGTVWREWLGSDQRVRLVPCPHCGSEIELVWEQVRWTVGEPASVHYVCQESGCIIHESDKLSMLPAGRWHATNPSSPMPGFTLSALYRPLGWEGWADLVAEYETALRSGDPELMRVFVNTALCRVFDESDDYAPPDGWDEGRSEEWPAPVPAGVALLTAGCDLQDDRIEIETVGWGLGEESWSVDYSIIYGDPSGPALWQDLDRHLAKVWRHETHAPMKIEAVCLDTGGHHTHAAYAYTNARAARRIWGIHGAQDPSAPIWPKKARISGGRWKWFQVGVTAIKDRVVPRLRIDTPGPGYCHVPEGRSPQWFAQMKAEQKRSHVVNGRTVTRWVQGPRRNEALDCRVYAYAALYSLLATGLSLQRALDERQPVGQSEQVRAPVRRINADHGLPTADWLDR